VSCFDLVFGSPLISMIEIDSGTQAAFFAAFTATTKVFLMGLAGFFLIWRKIIKIEVFSGVSAMVGNLTLPCMIFHRFAVQFDPQTFPLWWLVALAGVAIQIFQLLFGWLVSRRHRQNKGRDEMWYLLGYQNAGFFVLPMLQALLPAREFDRAAVWLFVLIMFFNASIWPAGMRILLKKRDFDARYLLKVPPTLWTLISLIVFGVFHSQTMGLRDSMFWQILIGGSSGNSSPGVIQLIGDLTVPLATLVLGGTVAQTALSGIKGFTNKRAALEVNLWKLVALPAIGWAIIRFWPTPMFEQDQVLRLLIMLQFAAPVAVQVSVFCAQHGYPTRLVPAASVLSYTLCILTVPLWVALVL
jgi:predicted permease